MACMLGKLLIGVMLMSPLDDRGGQKFPAERTHLMHTFFFQ